MLDAQFKQGNENEEVADTMTQVFRCPVCRMEFITEDTLEEHKAQGHVFRCDACGTSFPSEERLEQHARQAHP